MSISVPCMEYGVLYVMTEKAVLSLWSMLYLMRMAQDLVLLPPRLRHINHYNLYT